VHSHSLPEYRCPFCELVGGAERERNSQADVVWQDETTTAFVSPKWWETNPAHVIVVPNDHFENLYEIPAGALGAVYETAKRIALALRSAYGCDGTSTRQHNEPGGGQDVWHFHVHVFPRYEGDRLYEQNARVRWTETAERLPYAERLRAALQDTPA
jgi:histidine triad (HIT) family protein